MGAVDPDPDAMVPDLLLLADDGALSVEDLTTAERLIGYPAGQLYKVVDRLCAEGRLVRGADGLFRHMTTGSGPQPGAWREIALSRRVWTGCWLMAAALPGSGVAVADALDAEGFRHGPEGLWLRPDTVVGGIDACRARLARSGVAETVFTGRLDRLEIDRARAAMALWAVEDHAAERRDLMDRLAASSARMASPDAETLRIGVALSAAAVRTLSREPILPLDWEVRPLAEDLVAALEAHERLRRQVWTDRAASA